MPAAVAFGHCGAGSGAEPDVRGVSFFSSVMLFSAIVLPLVMTLFDLPVLNFYQFVVFITVYATMLGRPIVFVLTRRCMQPDFIRDTVDGV